MQWEPMYPFVWPLTMTQMLGSYRTGWRGELLAERARFTPSITVGCNPSRVVNSFSRAFILRWFLCINGSRPSIDCSCLKCRWHQACRETVPPADCRIGQLFCSFMSGTAGLRVVSWFQGRVRFIGNIDWQRAGRPDRGGDAPLKLPISLSETGST